MDTALKKQLVMEELFEYELYRRLRRTSDGALRSMLDELIEIEKKHLRFWKDFFSYEPKRLSLPYRVKLAILSIFGALTGERGIHLILEAVETYGVRKYLSLWRQYKDTPFGERIKEVLDDEFRYEDRIVSEIIKRKINPERIRNIFIGFNDGIVELVGAVSGFFAAFQFASSVLVAGITVAVAGSLSMAAGIFVATSSEREVEKLDRDKNEFLGNTEPKNEREERPFSSAVTVGISYFLGALVPIAPVAFGARSIFIPVLTVGAVIVLVSFLLAFLSGMNIRRRIMQNAVIIAATVSVTYGIGVAVKQIFGINV